MFYVGCHTCYIQTYQLYLAVVDWSHIHIAVTYSYGLNVVDFVNKTLVLLLLQHSYFMFYVRLICEYIRYFSCY